MPPATSRSHHLPPISARRPATVVYLTHRASRAGDTFLCVLLVVYLATLIFEGPLRYGLASSGLANALYFRDLIPAGSLAFLFLRALLVDGKLEPLIAIPMSLLLFHGALAALLGTALFSILFGFKIFVFIPYGMAMWPLIRARLDSALTAALIMFLVTSLGVLINYIVGRMPWEGLEYDTAFGSVTTTRLWWISGGISRLPGLARTSFDAAMILGVTGMLAMVKFRAFLPRAALAVATLAALLPTTSKGMILAFPIAGIWLLIEEGRTHALIGRWMVYVLCTITIVLPLIVVFFDLGSGISSTELPELVFSAWERFTRMWPKAFDLLPPGPAALLGAGLGSIGMPQLFGDAPQRFNAGDSLTVFMAINFGVLGLLYCVAPALGLRRVARSQDQQTYRAYTGLLLIAYGYGVSSNMMEASFFSILFGICLGVLVTAVFKAPDARSGRLQPVLESDPQAAATYR